MIPHNPASGGSIAQGAVVVVWFRHDPDAVAGFFPVSDGDTATTMIENWLTQQHPGIV